MKKRNILWLTMDHVTFHHWRLMAGARPVLDTYERLCREGYAFDNCKSVHPLCLPCRASMLTGLYPHRHGHTCNKRFTDALDGSNGLDLLRQAGYRLCYYGKNHSGYEDLAAAGVEGWTARDYGNPYMSGLYRQYLEENGYQDPVYIQQWHMKGSKLAISAFEDGAHNLTLEDDFNNNNAGYLDNTEPVHEADFLVWQAQKWLETCGDQPFVLRVDTWGPHHAYQPPVAALEAVAMEQIQLPPSLHMEEPARGAITRQFLRHCREDMPIRSDEDWRLLLHRAYCQYTYIDRALGRLIDALGTMGLAENTAILMTADHGDALATAGGFFDKAGDMQEELMDIPMALYDPWARAPRRITSLTTNLDVLPTVLDLAGIPVPEGMDGRSLLAVAENRLPGRERLMCEHYGHFGVHQLQRALYEGNYKYIYTQDDVEQLYDLSADPFEMRNLALEMEAAPLLARMREALRTERLRTGDS
ncbi:MAG: sulfatase-like hydrolase/transferase [Aristaeellaceae bacterium]